MSRMYPPVIPAKAPPGERKLFKALQTAPGTRDWIVLHSLELAIHQRQLMGEIDFVVIIPRLGVVCVEVKSHEHITVENGRWLYGERREPGTNPFSQATGGLHTLRQYIARKEPGLAGIPFRAMVALPNVCFRVASPEWQPGQVIDQEKLAARTLPELLREELVSFRVQLAGRAWFDGGAGKPDRGQCERLLHHLRPNFEVVQSPVLLRRQLDRELHQYTAQQMEALDAMADNPRVLFSGAAGTGKTLLALEAARRALLQGQRVLLLCYNRQLGEHLRAAGELMTASSPGRLWVGTIHSLALAIAGTTSQGIEAGDSRYWDEELPEKALGRLVGEEEVQRRWQFDLLILDEAQDLLRPALLDVLDMCTPTGLARGQWLMFGDFAQSLYNEHLYDFSGLNRYVPGITWVPYRLTNNCRNTPRIGGFVQKMARLQPRYARHLRPDDHNLGDPVLAYFDAEEDQVRLLAETLEKLWAENKVPPGDIMVLSGRAGVASAAGRLAATTGWGKKLLPVSERPGEPVIHYTTIHGYKGLEAPVVVVTDIYSVAGEGAGTLFYVAASRARDRLIMLVAESARPELIEMLIRPEDDRPNL